MLLPYFLLTGWIWSMAPNGSPTRRWPRRQTPLDPDDDTDAAFDTGDPSAWAIDTGPEPDWLEDAACAFATAIRPGAVVAESASEARSALRHAGIPCHIIAKPVDDWEEDSPPPHEYCVMVPGALQLHAASVLDRLIFNPTEEANWRTHFESLTNEQLSALDPDIFCAGILDRAERLRKAYTEEVSRRDPTQTAN